MRRLVALTALCAFLASCASPSATRTSVAADHKLDSTGTMGLVVGSITYDSGLGVYSISFGKDAARPDQVASVGWSMWPPLGPVYDDDLKAKGGTFAIEVPAGEYKLAKWFIRQGYIIYKAEQTIGIPFTVEAGKVTYLGNIHFQESGEVSLRDRSSRDIPTLKARFSAVKAADVGLSIAEGFNLDAIGGATQRSMQMPALPVYVPIKR